MFSKRQSFSLACTNPDGEGAAAAERGDSTIRDQNGQIIHILNSSTKSPPPGQNAGCVIYDRHKQNKIYLVKPPFKIAFTLNGKKKKLGVHDVLPVNEMNNGTQRVNC